MEAVENAVDVRQERIALIESISNIRKELGAPQIEAEEFDAMYDAEMWMLKAFELQLLTYKEMKAML